MWNLKCKIIQVITGATGIMTKGLKKDLEVVPRKHSVDSLHKTAVLGSSRIILKILQSEIEAFAVGITVVSGEVPGRKGL
jgi:hypothetical protein